MEQLHSARRRAELLHAAALEFDEVGYAAASLSKISARLGRTKGALGHHFPSKASLAYAVVETQYSQWEGVLGSVKGAGHRGIDALIVLAFVVAARFREDVLVRAAVRLQADPALRDAELPRPFVGWLEMTARLLREADALGELTSVMDLSAAAEVLVEAFTGAQEVAKRTGAMHELEARVRGYWLLSLPGLGVHDGAQRVARLAGAAAGL